MNEFELTLGWMADTVRGRIVSGNSEQRIGRIVIDSRTLQRGDFFVALRGAKFDGHSFLEDAFAHGAAGAIVERGFNRRPVAAGSQDAAMVEVSDTTKALQDVAHGVRAAVGTRVVAITGSAGKTTTKETIAAFLSTRDHVVKNKGNLNNHIGLPLSLLQLRDGPDVAVMELGMNHAGEIRTLVAIAEPDVRVWTNVGDAHMGFFGSVEALADAKAEILELADRDDVLVSNADDERITKRVSAFAGKTITFGFTSAADVRAEQIADLGVGGMRARVVTAQGSADLQTPLLGRGNLANVLAATAVALESGIPLADVVATSARLAPADRRGAVHRLGGGVVLIDDSYNSSPDALRRALDVVARDASKGRKVGVLGEMLELGVHSVRLHEESGGAAAGSKLDLLIVIGGEPARVLADAAIAAGMARSAVTYVETSEKAAEIVGAMLQQDDLVLVKGSRGIRTDIVADRIREEYS